MSLFDFALGARSNIVFRTQKTDEKMKSKRAGEYIEDNVHDAADLVDRDGCGWAVVGRHKAYHAVELAEAEMVEKAAQLFEQFMSGVFQGDIPKKMAEEFKQKLME
jgi:hypothetical protein